ncbi:MAG: prenyltransferase/squalene oxidase repeat-containing protein [Promethearchaeota archaeon]
MSGEKNLNKNGTLGRILLATIVCTTLFGLVGNQELVFFATAHKPNPAGQVTLEPIIDAVGDEYSTFVRDRMTSWGAFPESGSGLIETSYALQILDLVDHFNQYEYPDEVKTLVDDRYDTSEGAYKEIFEQNATIPSTYYALRSLAMVDRGISQEVNDSIVDFVNATLVNQTYFAEKNGSTATSPEVMYQAIWIVEYLGCDLADFDLDYNKTYAYFIDNYFQNDPLETDYGFFDTLATNRQYRNTRYSLLVLDEIGKLAQRRMFMHEYNASADTGTITSGNDGSMHEANDGQSLHVQSAGNKVELTFEFSLDDLYNATDEVFLFNMSLNLSTTVDTNGTVLLFNSNSSTWEQIESDNFLRTATGSSYTNVLFSTADIDVGNYTVNGGKYTTGLKLKLLFEHSSSFDLDVDFVADEYTVFDKGKLLLRMGDEFSNGRWDNAHLGENDYAIRILDHLDSAMDFMSPDDWLDMKDFIYTFQQDNGYFIEQSTDRFTPIEANYHALYLLDYMNEASAELKASMESYAWSWKFYDGGFGSYDRCSLPATYRALDLLNETGHLTTTVKQNVGKYLDACRPSGVLYFDDEDSGVTGFGDTFYAYKIADLVGYSNAYVNFTDVVDDLIDLQTPSGYFYTYTGVENIYYACSIVDRAGRVNDLHYLDAARNYIKNLQLYHGGFLGDPFQLVATVEDSVFAVKALQVLNALEQVRLLQVGTEPGVVDYIKGHQSPVFGGVYEENAEFYVEDTYQPTNEITAIACDGLADLYQVKALNASGLEDYVFSKMEKLNEMSSLENNTGVYSEIKDRYYAFKAYEEIQRNRLKLRVYVNDDFTFPGQHIPINITVYDPSESQAVEGCDLYVHQGDTAIQFNDLQNGSYSSTLMPYNSSNYYAIKISCDHPDYLGFFVNYNLSINHPLAMDKLRAATKQVTWFKSAATVKVPLYLDNPGEFASGCNVTLWKNGSVQQVLEENNQTGFYEVTIEYSPWMLTVDDYTLQVEGTLIRTEALPVRLYVVPVRFLVLAAIVLAIAIVSIHAAVRALLVRRYEEMYILEEPLSPKQAALAKEYIAKKKARALETEEKAKVKASRAREKAMRTLEKGREKAQIAALKAQWAAERSAKKAEIVADKKRRKELKAQERAERAHRAWGIKAPTSRSIELHAERELLLAEKRRKEEERKTELHKRKQMLKTIKTKLREARKTAQLEEKAKEKIAKKERKNAEKLAREERKNEILEAKIKKKLQKPGKKAAKLEAKLARKEIKSIQLKKRDEEVKTLEKQRREVISSLEEMEMSAEDKTKAAITLATLERKGRQRLSKSERKIQQKRVEYIKARKREEAAKKKLMAVKKKAEKKDLAAQIAKNRAEKEELETKMLKERAKREKLAATVAIEMAKIKAKEFALTREKSDIERMAKDAEMSEEERKKLLEQIDWQRSEKMKIVEILRKEKQTTKKLQELLEAERKDRQRLVEKMAEKLAKEELRRKEEEAARKKSKLSKVRDAAARKRLKLEKRKLKRLEEEKREKERKEIEEARARIAESRKKREEAALEFKKMQENKQRAIEEQRKSILAEERKAAETQARLKKELEKTVKSFDKRIDEREKVSDKARKKAEAKRKKADKMASKVEARQKKLKKVQAKVEAKKSAMERTQEELSGVKPAKKKKAAKKTTKKKGRNVK